MTFSLRFMDTKVTPSEIFVDALKAPQHFYHSITFIFPTCWRQRSTFFAPFYFEQKTVLHGWRSFQLQCQKTTSRALYSRGVFRIPETLLHSISARSSGYLKMVTLSARFFTCAVSLSSLSSRL